MLHHDSPRRARARLSAFPETAAPQAPAWSGRGRPPVARYRAKPSSLRDLVIAAGAEQAIEVCRR